MKNKARRVNIPTSLADQAAQVVPPLIKPSWGDWYYLYGVPQFLSYKVVKELEAYLGRNLEKVSGG
jgi:hypothetical protein